jgi:hypothetical protein
VNVQADGQNYKQTVTGTDAAGHSSEGGICVTLSLDEADPRFPPPNQGDA